jgi:hypothetical protein
VCPCSAAFLFTPFLPSTRCCVRVLSVCCGGQARPVRQSGGLADSSRKNRSTMVQSEYFAAFDKVKKIPLGPEKEDTCLSYFLGSCVAQGACAGDTRVSIHYYHYHCSSLPVMGGRREAGWLAGWHDAAPEFSSRESSRARSSGQQRGYVLYLSLSPKGFIHIFSPYYF